MKADYLASIDRGHPIRDLGDFLQSQGYRRINGLIDNDQSAGLENLGMCVYEIEDGQISSRGGSTLSLFSTSPPLNKHQITEARRKHIELYKVEKL